MDWALHLCPAPRRTFTPPFTKDEYREQLEALVHRKTKGRKATAATEDDNEGPIPPTINLMEALRKSLAANKSSTPHRKSA
jgi:non-homologous end joining protein Ku